MLPDVNPVSFTQRRVPEMFHSQVDKIANPLLGLSVSLLESDVFHILFDVHRFVQLFMHRRNRIIRLTVVRTHDLVAGRHSAELLKLFNSLILNPDYVAEPENNP